MKTSEDDLLTVKEASLRLRVSQPTVMSLVHGKTGHVGLPYIRLGRRILIRRSTLEKFICESEKLESAA